MNPLKPLTGIWRSDDGKGFLRCSLGSCGGALLGSQVTRV